MRVPFLTPSAGECVVAVVCRCIHSVHPHAAPRTPRLGLLVMWVQCLGAIPSGRWGRDVQLQTLHDIYMLLCLNDVPQLFALPVAYAEHCTIVAGIHPFHVLLALGMLPHAAAALHTKAQHSTTARHRHHVLHDEPYRNHSMAHGTGTACTASRWTL